MIIKHAQHFLTTEGRMFFIEWVKTLQLLAKKYPGFEQVWPLRGGEHGEEIHLLLIFADEKAYQGWVSGLDHSHVLEQLKPYSERPWQARTYVDLNELFLAVS